MMKVKVNSQTRIKEEEEDRKIQGMKRQISINNLKIVYQYHYKHKQDKIIIINDFDRQFNKIYSLII